MSFQQTVNYKQAPGIPGEFADGSPRRVTSYNLKSSNVPAVKATGSIVLTSTPPVANDTVSINGQTYTFVSSLSSPAVANEVLIGASAAESALNLVAAINKSTGEGTTYGTGTVKNKYVSAAVNGTTTTTVDLTALEAGVSGNIINLTESLTSGLVTAMANGVDAVAAPVVIGNAFTETGTAGKAQVGGTGVFAGILVNPKEHTLYGGLSATMQLPDGSNGALCRFGVIYVKVATDVDNGYKACYRTSDGAIGGYSSSGSLPTGCADIPNGKFIFVDGTSGKTAVLQLGD